MVLIYGVCKICDFGWSIYNNESDMRSTLCGTLLYISPEMLVGKDYNQKIDVWAYGILVYELFTGENPFKIREKSDLNRVITEEVTIGDNMPEKLKDFLLFALIKDITLRPTAE
jgi:serine/threonine protein kinase